MELVAEQAGVASSRATSSNQELARAVLGRVFARRQLVPGEAGQPVDLDAEMAPHLPKVLRAIEAGTPVRLILPAFPAKSPSRLKTLSHLPDMGEELAFQNLSALCDEISSLYAPGARVTICSDGRVFADVVRIPDDHVTDYNRELREHVKRDAIPNIDFFDLDDVYPGVTDFTVLREELMIKYGEPLESLKERCKNEREAAEMYRGITRFMFEDFSGLDEFRSLSRTTVQNIARTAAYRVIQRSNAWGRLLARTLPECVRLSIHPQFRVSEKIGINLIDSSDTWATPWHSVVLQSGSQVSLVPRHAAEKRNAALIFRKGRPSHFVEILAA